VTGTSPSSRARHDRLASPRAGSPRGRAGPSPYPRAWRRSRRLGLALLLAGLAGPGGWGTGGQPVAAQDTTASGVVERWVQVDGRGTRALCTTGDVRVLLLHDAGGDAETWLPVLRRLQGRAGACAYDRTAEDGAGDPEGEGGPGEELAYAAEPGARSGSGSGSGSGAEDEPRSSGG